LNFLKQLNRQNKMTLLIVIHDINLAARYSDKLVLLKDGEILDIGTPEKVITSENMEKAYEMNMLISHNLFTNSPHIIPLYSNKKPKDNMSKKRVHVICGGGTGNEVITTLEMNGYDISVGVVNIGDSDWDLSKKLSLKIIEETPFSEISQSSHSKNLEEISKSNIIVLTSVPYGNGNIKNLEAAHHALELGKKVYLIDQYNKYEQFDYVEGKAKKLIEMMKEKGLVVVNSVERLLEVI